MTTAMTMETSCTPSVPSAPAMAVSTPACGTSSAAGSSGSPTPTRTPPGSSPTTTPTCRTSATSAASTTTPAAAGTASNDPTCSPPASPASRGPTPELDSVLAMLATSGPPSRTPSEFYDHASSCWRMSQGSLDFGLELDAPSATWPVWGTTRDGACWALTTSVPHTGAAAGSASPGTGLLPTPLGTDSHGHATAGGGRPADLLPTPAACNPNDGDGLESWTARRDRLLAQGINGNGMGTPLSIAVQLLPTPAAADGDRTSDTYARGNPTLVGALLLPTPTVATGRQGYNSGRSGDRAGEPLLSAAVQPDKWGRYATAVARWEAIVGRPAPEPTEPGKRGQPRLAPRFVEWMMGAPDGHVTAVPGVSRTAQLARLGNGVVPQQAAAAVRLLLGGAA